MKRILIAVLLLASLTGCLFLGSCAESDVKTTVHLKIIAGDDYYTIFNSDVAIKTSADAETAPTVIDLLYAAIEQYRSDITISEDETTVDMIAVYPTADVEGVTYFWTFQINGKDAVGNENENFLQEGDQVVYRFKMLNERGDAVNYDNTLNVFEKNLK
jgi:hypothetical protein